MSLRMVARGWRVILPVVVVTAIVQALLVWPSFSPSTGWWTALAAVLSAAVLGVAFGLVAVGLLAAGTGPVRWASTWAGLRARALPYAAWAVLWGVAVSAGLALAVLPGLVIAAVTAYLLLAVLDGAPRPLARSLRTIARAPGRWLLLVVIVGLVILIGWVLTGVVAFLLRPPLAALVVWLVGGLAGAWVTAAWVRAYRRAWSEPDPGAAPEAPDDPDLEPAP